MVFSCPLVVQIGIHACAIALAFQAPPAAVQPTATAAPLPHRLDGVFDDWKALDPVATRHDKTGEAGIGTDIQTVSLASDDRDFWLFVEFAQPLTLQGLDKPLVLLVDTDGSPKSGAQQGRLPGADLAIICSPSPGDVRKNPNKSGPPPSKEHGQGVQIRVVREDGSFGDIVRAADVGLGIAPAHASRRFEFRLPRGPERFNGMTAAVQVAVVEKLPDGGEQYPDTIETARCLIGPRAAAEAPKVEAPSVARAEGTTLRVVSWNAEAGGLFKTPEPFAATLNAIGPDVVLFQELGGKATAEELAAWMNTNVGSTNGTAGGASGSWQAIVSGGDLRTGVVARRPLKNAPFLDGVKRESPKGDRPVRVVGAVLDLDGQSILLASLHLKCCGRLASSEDETRLAEAAAIHDALRQATEKSPFAAIIVGGDFNLVGEPSVIDRISAGLDGDGSPLDPVDALQLNGIANATWRSADESFVPGRLDWMLVSGASARVARSFVFNTDDLSAQAIAALALPASALKEPSDHMPVVTDFILVPIDSAALKSAPPNSEAAKP